MSISSNIPRYFNAKLAFLKTTKQTPLKRKRLFQPSIFRCQLAVSFREGNFPGFCLGQTESNKNSPAVKFAAANPPWRMASGGAACYVTTTAWMSQEVSKWLVNGLFHLLLPGTSKWWICHRKPSSLIIPGDLKGFPSVISARPWKGHLYIGPTGGHFEEAW